jgi:hypothetical protein
MYIPIIINLLLINNTNCIALNYLPTFHYFKGYEWLLVIL